MQNTIIWHATLVVTVLVLENGLSEHCSVVIITGILCIVHNKIKRNKIKQYSCTILTVHRYSVDH